MPGMFGLGMVQTFCNCGLHYDTYTQVTGTVVTILRFSSQKKKNHFMRFSKTVEWRGFYQLFSGEWRKYFAYAYAHCNRLIGTVIVYYIILVKRIFFPWVLPLPSRKRLNQDTCILCIHDANMSIAPLPNHNCVCYILNTQREHFI